MADLPPAPAARALEVKRKLHEPTETFELERWLAGSGCFVGRWLAQPDNRFGAPAGVSSWGVWWRTRPYGAYRIHDPEGALLLYRVDVVEDVQIDDAGVRYRDLLLDARIRPGPNGLRVRLEDEDEVEQAARRGLLSPGQQRRLRWTRELFLRRPERVVARIDAAIAQAIEAVRAGAHNAEGGA